LVVHKKKVSEPRYKCERPTIISTKIKTRKITVVCFLLGNSPASKFYMPTFRNTLLIFIGYQPMKMEKSVPKRRHIKIHTQKKTYNIQNTAKVWNQENYSYIYLKHWVFRPEVHNCFFKNLSKR
jgi:hypothetical protein